MTYVMLVGLDVALLEGIAQSLGRQGQRPVVVSTLAEARESALVSSPLMLIVDRGMAAQSGADLLSVPVCPGGARVLYRRAADAHAGLLPALQRAVLADLTLPLERYRLLALVQSVSERARATGRADRPARPTLSS